MPANRDKFVRYDAVIIGSGVSGLTAAITLAQRGRKVAVVEKSKQICPLIRRFKRGNVWCDPAFHYTGGFEDSGALSVLFRYLGMRDMIHAVPMKDDAYDLLHFGHRQIPLPTGFDALRDTLCSHFPKSRQAIHKYIESVKALMVSTPFISYDMEFGDFTRLQNDSQSLTDYLQSAGAEEELQQLLGQYGEFLYGVAGHEVPFPVHAITMGTFYKSPHTLAHGGDDIVDAFETRLEQEGVDLFCGQAVTGLKVANERRLQGVEIDGDAFLETENCIYTAHPGLLSHILPRGSVKPAYISRLKDLENTFSTFALYLEVDEIPERIANTNMYKLLPGENELKSDSILAIMSCDPAHHDGRKKALCVLKGAGNLPFGEEAYRNRKKSGAYYDYKARETEKAVRQLEDFFPEIKGKFKVVDSATPYTYERYTGTPGGSMYGVKHSVNQIGLNPVTSIVGFYLAGQSILMPGVMGAAISGFLGASKIIGLEKLWKEVQKCR
ncbi:MAG: NAD(P)/FAD-dependent oxidoreductase [Proteobacteria bacterium]|nr:NAD(P)/FAD-dependent oxidoreductase [Pseudomonadota bacterium]